METAVDRQYHSIDKNSVLTREKCNHARDIIWCGGPADRESVTKGCHYCFTFLEICSGLTRVETGCHGIDPRATRAVLERQGAREVRDGSLCGVIGAQPPISA